MDFKRQLAVIDDSDANPYTQRNGSFIDMVSGITFAHRECKIIGSFKIKEGK